MDIKELAIMAKNAEVCKEGFACILNSCSKEELLRLYIDSLDFCLSENFPSVEYMEANGRGLMERFGIHANEEVESVNEKMTVLLGSCKGEFTYNRYSVSDLYVKHGSQAHVVCSENSILRIDCFDASTVIVEAKERSKVTVNAYIGALVSASGNVNVIYKNKKSY